MGCRSRSLAHDRAVQGKILNLFQSVGQGIRVAADFTAGLIRLILTGTGNSHLNEGCRNGGNHNGHNQADEAAILIIIGTAAEDSRPLGNIGNHGNDTCHGRSHAGNQGVTMLHMGKLMSQHTGNLIVVQCLHQAGSHRHSCMGRIPAGGKGIWHTAVDDAHLRHRQLRIGCQVGHQIIELRRIICRHLPGTVGLQHNGITEPVGTKIHGQGKQQHYHRTAAPGKGTAHSYQDTHQQGH